MPGLDASGRTPALNPVCHTGMSGGPNTVEDRMGVLLFQLSALVSGTGWFAGGVQHRGVGCKQLIVGSARRRTARSSAAL
jgi:hypothetical protein